MTWHAIVVVVLFAETCNRGADPVGPGMVVSFYEGDPAAGGLLLCTAETVGVLLPGQCEEVGCTWEDAPAEGGQTVFVWVDRDAEHVECVEENNVARLFDVQCVQ